MTRHESTAPRRAVAGRPPKFAASLSSVAALIAGLAVSQANALSLGPVNVQSALGEPLRAEVDVSDISAAEAANLQLNIASAELFRQAGIAYNPALGEVRASLQRRADGRYVIRLAGTRALSEPFVDLLLEANWSSGRIVRDYTLLLDPPSNRPAIALAPSSPQADNPPAATTRAVPLQAVPPPPQISEMIAARPAPAPAPAAAQAPAARPPLSETRSLPVIPTSPAAPVAPVDAGTTTASAPPTSAEHQITVQQGDTAGEIARTYKPAEISLDQMLLALLRTNPNAFIGGNVNRMRSGAVINLPTAAEAAAVPPAKAQQTVIAQSRDFGEYRRRLADNAPSARIAAADHQATGRLQTTVEDRSAAAPSADRLTIAQGGAAPGNDEALLKARQAQESQARLAELSRNINDLNKLTADGGSVSGASGSAATTRGSPAVAAVPATVAVPAPGVTGAAAVATAPSRTAPPPPRSFTDILRANQFVLLALGLVLLLLLLAYRVRGRRNTQDAGESLFLESNLPKDSFFGIKGGEPAGLQSRHSAMPSVPNTPSQLDGDVDPVAEADVYLAYGRDQQAEEILREALRMNPDRLAIHSKLLEIHAKRRDLRAYETLATTLRELTHGTGSDWQRAAEAGQELDPGNPLYDSGAPAFADTVSGARTGTAIPGAAEAFSTAMAAAGSAYVPAPPTKPTVAPIDFDLGLDDDESERHPAAMLPATPFDDASAFGLANSPQADPLSRLPSMGDSRLLEFDLGDLAVPATRATDTDIDRLGAAFDADGESPQAIKLSLARELHALGDTEGARTLAEEVAAESSGDLQADAVRLLSQLH